MQLKAAQIELYLIAAGCKLRAEERLLEEFNSYCNTL
jgi:hypothetical protein